MLMHGLDDFGCRDRPCARETLQKRYKAKEMIAVSVGDVNRGEVLSARDDPIQQSLRLLGREKGVHENGVGAGPLAPGTNSQPRNVTPPSTPNSIFLLSTIAICFSPYAYQSSIQSA